MESSSLIPHASTLTFTVLDEEKGTRIDRLLPLRFPQYSRSFFQKLIDHEHIKLNGEIVRKHSQEVALGDIITVTFPEQKLAIPTDELKAKVLQVSPAVEVLFEHEHFLIISKPAGLLVHAPSPAYTGITLVDWLVVHFPNLAHIGEEGRPAIVHRLDKDTSGLMIIPRTPYAHKYFSDLFKQRKIHKVYLAIVAGNPPEKGTINLKIDRHPTDKTRMSHFYHTGREACTYFRVREYFKNAALIEANPVTGRTHQIRVHFTAIGHPLIGDAIYGNASKLSKRHMLHAWRLGFIFDHDYFEFTQQPPEDFNELVEELRKKM